MGLPPRPKDRPLVRRAVVASLLVSAGCDQGVKPSVPPQTAPDYERVTPPQVAPQVAWDAEPMPTAEVEVAPQVAYANGFTLQLTDTANKPLANVAVKVTLAHGEAITATTSDDGTAFVRARVSGPITVSIDVQGYQPATDVQIDGDMHPFERVVMKKKRSR